MSEYNCINIVHASPAKVLGGSFQTDALYQWTAAGEPPEEQLDSVTYPRPDGQLTVSRSEVETYWAGVDMQDVFDPVRCKRCGSKAKDQRRFIFLVARHLREKTFLEPSNKPSVLAREMTRCKCPQQPAKSQVNIGPKFPKENRNVGIANK